MSDAAITVRAPHPAKKDRLLSRKEAASYLEDIGCPRISVRTLEAWASNGNAGKGPPFTKLRKAVGYRRADLDAWAYREARIIA